MKAKLPDTYLFADPLLLSHLQTHLGSDGLITLVLTTATDTSRNDIFAANEHATVAPPKLRLTYDSSAPAGTVIVVR